MKLGLQNILSLLEYTDTDYGKLKSVHVAGTNGKGSVSNIISHVLTACGYKTGLFTSPHLQRFNERIKINGAEISDDELSYYIGFFKEGIEKFNCTFFEANTAIAIRYFIDKEADIAVIETGLGGRLDSTNVIKPLVSVITGIDYDHQKQLGNSIIQIAKEKAGIIKRGIPVVVNTKRDPVKKIFTRTAIREGSEIIFVDKKKFIYHKTRDDLSVRFYFRGKELVSEIALLGTYQEDNIATALTVLKVLSKMIRIEPEKLQASLSEIKVKGRMEVISEDPFVLIDAAHNEEGLACLKKYLDGTGMRIHMIFGTVKDKDYEKILRAVSEIKAKKYYSQADNKRALEIESIRNSRYVVCDKCTGFYKTPLQAYNEAVRNFRKGDIIVVTGSHFIIGDLLNSLNIKN